MFKEDGSKRQGKFLKGNSSLIKKVRIEEFNFKDISTRAMAYPDNPTGNIVHAYLHEKSELARIVKPASVLFEELLDPSMKAPVIRPRDFTNDWLEERRKQRRRSSNQYADEDEFEMAMEEEEGRERSFRRKKGEQNQVEDEDEEDVDDSEGEETQATTQTPAPVSPSSVQGEQNSLQDLKKSDGTTMDQVGMAIKGFNENVGELSQSSLIINPKKNAKSNDVPEDPNPTESASSDPESKHAETSLGEEDLTKAYNAGIEEGLAQANARIQEKEQNLEKLASELRGVLEKLKQEPKEILKDCEGNFFELTAAICENLLGKEFNADPKQFKELVLRAIAEGIDEKNIIIKVSKRAYGLLTSSEALGTNWQADPELTDFEFKILSQSGNISSNLSTLVKSLIAELDIKLFPTTGEENNQDSNKQT